MKTDLLPILEAVAHNLWNSALQSSMSGNNRRLWDRMNAPQVGDWVLEITSLYIIKKDRNGFGKLLTIELIDGGDKNWTIETPDGKTCNWSNARFVAIPLSEFDWYPPANP